MNVYKVLNSVRSELIVYGDPFGGNEDVIVVITGSPGIPEFYTEFAEELHKNMGLPVCVVGHAGQDTIQKERQDDSHDEALYSLKGQVQHKLYLLDNIISKNSKIHLIGHSIGAWILLEILDKNDRLMSRILSVQLLFPTLQNISEAAMAVYFKIPRIFHILALLSFRLFKLMPKATREFFIKMYLRKNSLPEHYVHRIMTYLDPQVGKQVLKLAFDIMDAVTTLNVNSIEKVKHLTNVIYSPEDHWVPIQHIEDLKRFTPQLKLKELNVNHAFVLKSTKIVAESAADFIKNE